MRYSNRLARANQDALAPDSSYEDDTVPLGIFDQSEESSCGSALTGGSSIASGSLAGSSITGSSFNGSVPSALRRGKYSRYYYSRRDNETDGNNSIGSSIDSYSSFGTGYDYGNPKKSYKSENNHYGKRNGAKKGSGKLQTEKAERKSQPIRNEMEQFSAHEAIPSHVHLVNGVSVGNSGYILARYTFLSRFFKKKWKELIWVHCKPATIIFFASQKNCLKWMRKKYLSTDEKKKLIKHSIDFDTQGVLSTKQDPKQTSSSSKNILKYSMSDVRSKREDVDGSYSHRFTLDRWKNSGTEVGITFCSTNVMEVKHLRKTIRKCMKKVDASSSKKNRRNENEALSDVDSKDDVGSDISGNFSRASKSSIASQSKNSMRSRKHRRRRL